MTKSEHLQRAENYLDAAGQLNTSSLNTKLDFLISATRHLLDAMLEQPPTPSQSYLVDIAVQAGEVISGSTVTGAIIDLGD